MYRNEPPDRRRIHEIASGGQHDLHTQFRRRGALISAEIVAPSQQEPDVIKR